VRTLDLLVLAGRLEFPNLLQRLLERGRFPALPESPDPELLAQREPPEQLPLELGELDFKRLMGIPTATSLSLTWAANPSLPSLPSSGSFRRTDGKAYGYTASRPVRSCPSVLKRTGTTSPPFTSCSVS
jgi:hypothetical protein